MEERHKKERIKDVYVSVLVLIICFVFYMNTGELTPPADIFPKAVILILSVLGGLLLIKALWLKGEYVKSEEDEEDDGDVNVQRKWLSIVALIAYVIVIPMLGFYVTSSIFLLGISWYLAGMQKKLRALLIPVIVSSVVMSVIFIAFSILLRVPVPKGILF
jgi:hypothetical protein